MSGRRSRSGHLRAHNEVFDLRNESVNVRGGHSVLPDVEIPEIYEIRPQNRREHRRHKSKTTRCTEPECEICRALEEEKLRTLDNNGDQGNVPVQPSSTIGQVGLNVQRYQFYRKTPQLDTAIGLVTQLLDERLQSERYREAAELRKLLTELLESRRKAEELLINRRQSLQAGDLESAQALKTQYDQLTFKAVDFRKLRPHMTEKQTAALAALRRF
ncbi:hypothetical protein M3Y98_00269500 [Aphelenchoides besseyi]|nr:hypothetical protein M3Y98_00269500 [Aphelenchoides besseyi]KAI6200937.1 hypothetical protein M3Y96_00787700 [Aphelenchoides besseyi]